MALSCQMQIFEVYETMSNPSLERMNSIVKSATNICTTVYVLVGFFGYVAFCNQEFSGNILLNFSPSFASDVMKIGFVISVAFSFPLVIFPCRASLYSLLYRRNYSEVANYIPEPRFKWMTFVIVIVTLLVGLFIPSIELVIGLVGSTIGVVICIIVPSLCFLRLTNKDSNEKSLAKLIAVFGFSLMILGTYANLEAIDEKKSGPIGKVEFIEIVQPSVVAPIVNEVIKEIELGGDERNNKLPVEDVVIKDVKEEKIEIKETVVKEKLIEKLEKLKVDGIDIVSPKAPIELAVSRQEEELKIIPPPTDQIRDHDKNQPKKDEIDVNAIKKEDEVVKEEKIDGDVEEKKEKIEQEIKQLEETKKQLEQEVNVMKEIVQQSLEDPVVAEKDSSKIISPIKNPVVQLLTGDKYENPTIQIDKQKDAENQIKPIDLDSHPDSYKVGESISEIKNKHEPVPPIPIVIQNLTKQNQIRQEKMDIVEDKNSNVLSEKEKNSKPNDEVNKQQQEEVKNDEKSKQNEQFDSIRRDLLEASDEKKIRDSAVTPESPVNLIRDKREADDENCDRAVEGVKQLTDQTFETNDELGNLLRLNIERDVISVGRDLKSISEKSSERKR